VTRLRVLMVNKFLYPRGGAELAMLELSRRLEQAGAECLFFGMRDPRNPPELDSPHLPEAVDFERPSGLREPLRAGARMLYSTSARRGIERLLATERVDVAHLHNIYHQLSPSILGPLRAAGIPVVMTAHDYKLVCPVYTLLSHGGVCTRCVGGSYRHAVARRCLRGSLPGSAMVALESRVHRSLGVYRNGVDVFAAPSRYMERMLVAGGYPAERISVVPNSTDIPAAAPGPAGDSILFAGRLSAEKGVDVLLEAAAGTGIRVRIAGDGPEREPLERLAAARGARAEFLGRIDRPRLEQEFARARAVVLPSVWPENAPLVVLEAMAHGRPVIASSIGGIPELVRDGGTGLLVAPGDVRELRDAMIRLTGDGGLAAELGLAGRRRVEAEHAPAAHVQRTLALYARARDTASERAAA
jgi:glycosyltransferase involved in cell wall biosynthesis